MNQETLNSLVQRMIAACDETDRGEYKHAKQVRAAICSALTGFLPDPMVGEAVGLSRTTVIYHARRHPMNMSGWNGYKKKYLLCSSMYLAAVDDCKVCCGAKMITISNEKESKLRACPLCNVESWLSSI